ncbi:MAG: carbon-nitrogen hydrolase family protein [Pseudomonadota bacterium]
MSRFLAACVQLRSGIDPEQNQLVVGDLIADAAGQDAKFVQTPEMTGFVQKRRAGLMETVRKQDDDPIVAAASGWAKQHEIWLHIGSTAILRDDGKVANRAFVFAPDGALISTYDKIHMFDVDLDNGESWRESAIYESGTRSVLTRAAGATIGLGICYDVRFPALANTYAQNGAEVLTFPACFTRQTGRAHWHTLMQARAIENGAYVISAAQGGDHEDGRETFGHSIIVDPWGEVIADSCNEEPGVVVAEIDLDAVKAARSKVPNLKNERAFTLQDDTAPDGTLKKTA